MRGLFFSQETFAGPVFSGHTAIVNRFAGGFEGMVEVRNALRWIPTRALVGTIGLIAGFLFLSIPSILSWLITTFR